MTISDEIIVSEANLIPYMPSSTDTHIILNYSYFPSHSTLININAWFMIYKEENLSWNY